MESLVVVEVSILDVAKDISIRYDVYLFVAWHE
jgi:hypothetical protein